MPKCKICHSQISRLDKEVCPFCGARKPLEGQDDTTEDITKAFDAIKESVPPLKYKKKIIASLLAFFLGVFGAHMFYLGKKKNGFIILACTLVFISTVGCFLFFTGFLRNVFAFLIPYFVIELLMIISAIMILVRNDIKDGRGEYLQ